MLSLAKRNSSTVAIAKKELINYLKSDSLNFILRIGYIWDKYEITCPIRATLPSGFINLNNLVIEESKNKIVIGLGISNLDFHFSVTDEDILSGLHYLPNSAFLNCEEISRVSWRVRRSAILLTPEFKENKKLISEIISSKYKITLKDGEFPSIKNREMLPILTLDFDKREVSHYTSARVDSYRKKVNRVSFDNLFNLGLYQLRLPLSLVSVDFAHKNFKAF